MAEDNGVDTEVPSGEDCPVISKVNTSVFLLCVKDDLCVQTGHFLFRGGGGLMPSGEETIRAV